MVPNLVNNVDENTVHYFHELLFLLDITQQQHSVCFLLHFMWTPKKTSGNTSESGKNNKCAHK